MNLGELLALFGGSSAVAIGLASLISKLLIKRLHIEWEKKANLSFERVRQALHEEKNRIQTLVQNYSQIYSIGQEARIDAIRTLWNSIFDIRKIDENAVFFYTILSPSEYDEAAKNPNFHESIYAVSNHVLGTGFYNIVQNVEKLRPFLNEYLWGLFSVYCSFSGRLTFILRDSAEKGRIKSWTEDPGIQSFLSAIFPKGEIEQIDLTNPLSLKTIILRIEEKIVTECANILSGHIAVDESLRQSQRIKAAVSKFDIENKGVK